MLKKLIAKLMSMRFTAAQKKIVHRYLMNDYFRIIEQNTVDIPEFLKPVEQRHTTQAWRMIEHFIQNGTFTLMYRRALAAVK
jgi:hypothetical protein